MLARRELSEAQVRTRLARREFDAGRRSTPPSTRLRSERALDDERTARRDRADRDAPCKRRGRLRVLRQIEARGIARDVARAAVDEVFGELDERRAARAGARPQRLRGRSRSPTTAAFRRAVPLPARPGLRSDRCCARAALRRRAAVNGSHACHLPPYNSADDRERDSPFLPRSTSSGTGTASSPARRSSRTTIRRCSSPTPG